MTQATQETSPVILSSFVRNNEEYVVIPKKEFQRLQRPHNYPKLYTEVDSDGVWETLDFWPEWVDTQDFIEYLRQ